MFHRTSASHVRGSVQSAGSGGALEMGAGGGQVVAHVRAEPLGVLPVRGEARRCDHRRDGASLRDVEQRGERGAGALGQRVEREERIVPDAHRRQHGVHAPARPVHDARLQHDPGPMRSTVPASTSPAPVPAASAARAPLADAPSPAPGAAAAASVVCVVTTSATPVAASPRIVQSCRHARERGERGVARRSRERRDHDAARRLWRRGRPLPQARERPPARHARRQHGGAGEHPRARAGLAPHRARGAWRPRDRARARAVGRECRSSVRRVHRTGRGDRRRLSNGRGQNRLWRDLHAPGGRSHPCGQRRDGGIRGQLQVAATRASVGLGEPQRGGGVSRLLPRRHRRDRERRVGRIERQPRAPVARRLAGVARAGRGTGELLERARVRLRQPPALAERPLLELGRVGRWKPSRNGPP
jgi:hypothetical protein